MKRTMRNVLAATVVVGVGTAGVLLAKGSARASESEDAEHEVPIQGEALKRASEAALAFTGGGRVTETEEGDEESYYEVEVTMDDGRQIDVQLDESFKVVGSESDDEDE